MKSGKYIIYFFLLFIAIACRQEEKIPEHILKPGKMTDIIIDIHIGEASVKKMDNSKKDSAHIFARKLEKEIYNNHKVKEKVFDSSYNYYLNHDIETMKVIYGRVVDSLSLKKATSNTGAFQN